MVFLTVLRWMCEGLVMVVVVQWLLTVVVVMVMGVMVMGVMVMGVMVMGTVLRWVVVVEILLLAQGAVVTTTNGCSSQGW